MITISESYYPFNNKSWNSEESMTRDLSKQALEVHRFTKDEVWISDISDEDYYDQNQGYKVIPYKIKRDNGKISFVGKGPNI